MIWTDLMLDRTIEDGVIAEALGHAFGLQPRAIGIVDALPQMAVESLTDMDVIVERTRRTGDFPLQLSIYLRRQDLEQWVSDQNVEQEVIARLCAEWQCCCLFSDESVNPYTWLLMTPTGLLEAVTVDADRLDDRDELAITRVDRIVRQLPLPV